MEVSKCGICGCFRERDIEIEAHLRRSHGVREHYRHYYEKVDKAEMTHCQYCPAVMSKLGLANHVKHKHPQAPHPAQRGKMHVADYLAEQMAQHQPPRFHTYEDLMCARALIDLQSQ